MKKLPSGERQGLPTLVISLVVAVAGLPLSLAAEQGLFLTGYTAMYGGGASMEREGGLKGDVLCGSEGVSELQRIDQAVLDRVAERLGDAGVPSAGELQVEAQAIKADLCQDGGSFRLEPQAITYSSCRMTMDQDSTLMELRMPTAETPGAMEMADFRKAEVMRIPLYQADESASAGAGSEAGEMNWTGPGDTRQIAGYPAARWDFAYSATMSIGGGMGMSVNLQTEGHGYFSKDIPGFELLDALYRKFLGGVSFDQGGSSFFGGMMKTWVGMLDRGMPLYMDQTTRSSMGAMGMGGDNRSVMKINSLRLVDLPSDFCTRELVPDHFAVTDVGQGLSGISITPGGGSEDTDSNAGGGVLGGLLKMMNSAGQQAPGAAPAGQPAAQSPAAAPAGSAARSGPGSSDLMSDNLTQSVQKHLQALGFSVGNTDGELDTNTIIAISQFQAERGMEVTGEVTPQLLGVLGAAVDAQQ